MTGMTSKRALRARREGAVQPHELGKDRVSQFCANDLRDQGSRAEDRIREGVILTMAVISPPRLFTRTLNFDRRQTGDADECNGRAGVTPFVFGLGSCAIDEPIHRLQPLFLQ